MCAIEKALGATGGWHLFQSHQVLCRYSDPECHHRHCDILDSTSGDKNLAIAYARTMVAGRDLWGWVAVSPHPVEFRNAINSVIGQLFSTLFVWW